MKYRWLAELMSVCDPLHIGLYRKDDVIYGRIVTERFTILFEQSNDVYFKIKTPNNSISGRGDMPYFLDVLGRV